MFMKHAPIFESKEHEDKFLQLCNKLKYNSFESPWDIFFRTSENLSIYTTEFENEVVEISLPELRNECDVYETERMLTTVGNQRLDGKVSQNSFVIFQPEELQIEQSNLFKLKEVLMNVQEGHLSEHQFQELNFLSCITSNQVPILCEMLEFSTLNEGAVAAFLTSILHLEKPLSLTTVTALIHHAVYPKVQILKDSSSRTLLTAILNFSETYPKAIIDEVIIPCLKKELLDVIQSELVLKIAKNHLPSEQISYCIKKILKSVEPVDTTFTTIKCLIERRVPHERDFYDTLIGRLQNWSVSNDDIKFTRLLISILLVYGHQLSKNQLSMYGEIIKSNKTILKKAVENLLKKIQQQM